MTPTIAQAAAHARAGAGGGSAVGAVDAAAPAAVPDAYLVRVHDALSLIMAHPVFQKIFDAPPLGINVKCDGKKVKGVGGE
jgi:hypothetical protein